MAIDFTTGAAIAGLVVCVLVIAGLATWVGIDQAQMKKREAAMNRLRLRNGPKGVSTGPGPVYAPPPPPQGSPAASMHPSISTGPGPVRAPMQHQGPQSAVGFSSQGAASPQCFNQNLVGAPIGPADSKMQGNYALSMVAPTSKPVPLGSAMVNAGRRVGQAGVQSPVNLSAYAEMGGAAGVSNLDTPEDLMVSSLLAGTQEMQPERKTMTYDPRGEVAPGSCNGGGTGSWAVGYSRGPNGELEVGPSAGAFTSQIGPYSLGQLPAAGLF